MHSTRRFPLVCLFCRIYICLHGLIFDFIFDQPNQSRRRGRQRGLQLTKAPFLYDNYIENDSIELLKKRNSLAEILDPWGFRLEKTYCRRCFRMFEIIRTCWRTKKKYDRFCSLKCFGEFRKIRCFKGCKSFIRIRVPFKDGSRHLKRICRKCRRGKFISSG